MRSFLTRARYVKGMFERLSALMTPLGLLRLGLVAAGAVLAAFMLDPSLQGAEGSLGLSDKAAHAVAFYLVTLGAFAALPRVRRTDAAGLVLLLAAGTEILQGLTGRSMSFGDLSADAVGILAAVLPALVDRWRYAQRVRMNASNEA